MPRIKTYSAASGFVYQYRFVLHQAESTGDLYHFETTQDRRASFDVSVLLTTAAVVEWEHGQQRTLSPTERYALAKMALFAAFDDASGPEAIAQPVLVDGAQVAAIARVLDL